MNFVRFMGEGEMEAYLNGKVLRNETNWKGIGKTDSQGFCFFPDTPAPEERLHYLSGVVDFDVVAVFATKGPIMLRKCSGSYRDPNEKLPGNLTEALFAPPKMIQVDEYSMKEYSASSLRLLRIGTVVFGDDRDWHIRWMT